MIDLREELERALRERSEKIERGEDPGPIVIGGREYLVVSIAPGEAMASPRSELEARIAEVLDMKAGAPPAFLHVREEDARHFLAPDLVRVLEAQNDFSHTPAVNRRASQRCSTCGEKIRGGHDRCSRCGTRRDGSTKPRGGPRRKA